MDNTVIPVGVYNRLGAKTYVLFLCQALAVPIIFGIVASGIALMRSYVPADYSSLARLAILGLSALFAVGIIIAAFISWVVYVNHGFMLTDDALKIKRGLLTKIENSIPYRQIQSIDVERTLGHQMLGLSRLIIITAGHDIPTTERNESIGVLPVIDKGIAVTLQDELLKRTDVQKVAFEK
jgi:uncharacterized membrane protein YdbT with pleckstrin-like domain